MLDVEFKYCIDYFHLLYHLQTLALHGVLDDVNKYLLQIMNMDMYAWQMFLIPCHYTEIARKKKRYNIAKLIVKPCVTNLPPIYTR